MAKVIIFPFKKYKWQKNISTSEKLTNVESFMKIALIRIQSFNVSLKKITSILFSEPIFYMSLPLLSNHLQYSEQNLLHEKSHFLHLKDHLLSL